jgi:hypothetical protein
MQYLARTIARTARAVALAGAATNATAQYADEMPRVEQSPQVGAPRAEISRTPYQQYKFNANCLGQFDCKIDFDVVPANSRLEITNVSCYVRTRRGAPPTTSVFRSCLSLGVMETSSRHRPWCQQCYSDTRRRPTTRRTRPFGHSITRSKCSPTTASTSKGFSSETVFPTPWLIGMSSAVISADIW